MCGIAGFVESSSRGARAVGARERLDDMLRAVAHRGPDDWGAWFLGIDAPSSDKTVVVASDVARVALGHRRLSILDLSPAGRQPMSTRDGDLTVTFNGEIYNYIELRAELSDRVAFSTGTDTEVLLAAWRTWGEGMFAKLDGMYAFALWDARRRKLVCARDPMGIKPFYWARTDDGFFFASEPRGVVAALGARSSIDRARLAEFLVLGISDHDDGTCHAQVHQLPGGHWLEVDADGTPGAAREHWRPKPIAATNGAIVELVRERLQRAVSRQLRSDVPVGGCLSGGLDSGTLAVLVGDQLGSRASSFVTLTLRCEGFPGDESAAARATATSAGLQPKFVELASTDLAAQTEDLVRGMDEPFTSLSMLAQRQIMRRASSLGLKVMLDGQGGDEVFLGYPRVATRTIFDRARALDLRSAVREWRGFGRHASMSSRDIVLQSAYSRAGALIARRNARRIEAFVDRGVLDALRPEVLHDLHGHDDMKTAQWKELRHYNLPRLLRYEDRNSMAYAVEARVPLLANDLVDVGVALPPDWLVHDGWTKRALREAMRGKLADDIAWSTQKRGFEVPQREWVQQLKPTLRTWLGALPRTGPFRADALSRALDGPAAGSMWYWRCLSAALWTSFHDVRS